MKNGLNTMYAHLSEIDVTAGGRCETGQIIATAAETGYATGPHLHFFGSTFLPLPDLKLGSATQNQLALPAIAVMPVHPLEGYLNPLNYL